MDHDTLLTELHSLRNQVVGITGGAVATVDGMLVAADVERTHPESLAAMAAAMMSLAQRASHEVGGGTFRETVTRCDSGYIAVYSVNEVAMLVVLADQNLNLGRLHLEARRTATRIATAVSGGEHLVK